ncbi:MAG: hypothetical protein KKB70_09340 [Proteobacteria bacterium]|nr:hypothetical protein [Pseudomonadota bacterium]MBU1610968.1 hypothetical protein [Pseudomonadota bacterium]
MDINDAIVKGKAQKSHWTGLDNCPVVDYLMLLLNRNIKRHHSFKEEYIMGRHKKHERKKELDRKRHRRKEALKAAVKEAKTTATK